MWKRARDNFDAGIEKVKWFSSLLNERMKVEISLFKLLYRSTEFEKRKSDLMKTIGGRVFELRHGPERNVLRDATVTEAITELERLDAEIEEVRKRAAEVGRTEA